MTLTQSLSDVLNYGLFQPAFNGRAGKFLDEERLLKEYPLPPITPIPYLEVNATRTFHHRLTEPVVEQNRPERN